MAHGLVDRPEAEGGQVLPRLLRQEQEEGLDELGRAREPLAQQRILRGDPHRAGIQMAHAHHDAAGHHQRRRGETELLRPQQRRDHHIAPGLQTAVDLHPHLGTQPIEPERLLHLGQPELPRLAGVFEGGERSRSGPAVVPRDDDDVGVRLGHSGRDGSDTGLGHQLHGYLRGGIGAAQVVDQLLQVLDGVDVVVRWRRDQPDARRGVPGRRDPRVDLVARKLPALTGFRALGHLDLDFAGVHQIRAGDAEPPGGHLLDVRATQGIEQALHVFAALAGVRLAAELVHRHREGLVRLRGDRSVRHRAGGEPFHDLACRFHLVQRHRPANTGPQLEQAAQRPAPAVALLHLVGVPAEHRLLLRPRRVLQQVHRLRVEQVPFALPPPLVLAADLEPAVFQGRRVRGEGERVPRGGVGRDAVDSGATGPGDGAGEVLVEHGLVEPETGERLRAPVRADGRDAHLAHHLEHALGPPVQHVVLGGGRVDLAEHAGGGQVRGGLQREVRVHRTRAVAQQQGHVVHLARVARLDHQRHLGARLGPD